MRSVRNIFLAGFVLIACFAGGVFSSSVQADTTSGRNTGMFYDGPCSSEANALCQISERASTDIVTEDRIAVVKSAIITKLALWNPTKIPIAARAKENVKRSLPYNSSRQDPYVWVASFRPITHSAMPTNVHRLKDPLAANRKAKELLELLPPVFKVIAACESNMRHYNEKTGFVLQGVITPGDVGLLQINSLVHEKTARKIGFNIHSIYGNIGYGKQLYIKEGTKPWNSSKKCWGPKVPPRLRLPLSAQV